MVNAVYGNVGTAKVWGDTGGDYTMTLSALATLAARVGARGDFGAWPHVIGYRWYAETEWTSAPTIDGQLEWHLGGWDTDTPGSAWAQLPSTDTAYAAAAAGLSKRKNLVFLGGPIIETSAVGPFSQGGFINFPFRYVSPMAYNNGSVALKTNNTATFLRLTPIYAEIQ